MNNPTSNQSATRFIFFALAFLMLCVCAALLPDPVWASGISEFEGPFQTVVDTITGKWGQMIAVGGMACCGVVFIFARQDMAEGFKMLLQVVFGICFIAFASSIVTSMFNFSGALI